MDGQQTDLGENTCCAFSSSEQQPKPGAPELSDLGLNPASALRYITFP